jgi:hypothetical protein
LSGATLGTFCCADRLLATLAIWPTESLGSLAQAQGKADKPPSRHNSYHRYRHLQVVNFDGNPRKF